MAGTGPRATRVVPPGLGQEHPEAVLEGDAVVQDSPGDGVGTPLGTGTP